MRNIVTVVEHVGSAIVPVPVPAANGQWLVDDEGQWRAWRLVADAHPTADSTPATASSAAQLLGRFHRAVAHLEPDRLVVTIPHFHDLTARVRQLHETIQADPCGRARHVRDLTARAFDQSTFATMATRLHETVPRRVAHNDAKLDNILFRDEVAVCLVDLDTVMPGSWFWDVGDLLRTAATSMAEDDPAAVVDHQLFNTILAAYRDSIESVATAAELDALPLAGHLVTYEQAVRFLADWLAGDAYYRTARPDQNLDRARAQFGLLESMPGTVTAP
jgi:Ser/Thr protein kinase RdoA (MazF antagonist)